MSQLQMNVEAIRRCEIESSNLTSSCHEYFVQLIVSSQHHTGAHSKLAAAGTQLAS